MNTGRWNGPLALSAALSFLLVLGGASGVQAADVPQGHSPGESGLPTLKYVDVADSMVMLQNEKPYGSNMTCFALDEGLVFVDTGLFTGVAGRFRREMEARFGKRTIALLLTPAHTDHFFGMGAFADVPVAAAAAGRERFRRQLSIDFAGQVEAYERVFPKFGEALETARPFMPTLWFEAEIAFGAGEDSVRFRSTGGHSSCSSYAYSPAAGVIAAGDNLQVDGFPYFGDPTTSMTAWIATLETWEGSGASALCPGHGRPVDLPYLASTRTYSQNLVSALGKLEAQRVPISEAVHHPSLPTGYWGSDTPEPPWFRPAIAGLYRSLGG